MTTVAWAKRKTKCVKCEAFIKKGCVKYILRNRNFCKACACKFVGRWYLEYQEDLKQLSCEKFFKGSCDTCDMRMVCITR